MWIWLSLLVFGQRLTSSLLSQTWFSGWFTSHHGVDFLCHYLLDDFLTLGHPASLVCYNNLQACIQLCSKLSLPLHPDKLEGPSTCLSILGIKLDSVRPQARLPIDKKESIITLLECWSGKRFCT